MTDITIVRYFDHPPETVWRAVTDPTLVPLWTRTGRSGRPEGFLPEPGTHFRLVAKPLPGWNGIVECEVLEAREPELLRWSWVAGDGHGDTTEVVYRLGVEGRGTRFTYEHNGFTGFGGFFMARAVLGPVRRRMLDRGLPMVLDQIAGQPQAPSA